MGRETDDIFHAKYAYGTFHLEKWTASPRQAHVNIHPFARVIPGERAFRAWRGIHTCITLIRKGPNTYITPT